MKKFLFNLLNSTITYKNRISKGVFKVNFNNVYENFEVKPLIFVPKISGILKNLKILQYFKYSQNLTQFTALVVITYNSYNNYNKHFD